jgi:hypothetical protein
MSAEPDGVPLLFEHHGARIVLHRTPLDWVAFIRGEEVAFFDVDQEAVLHQARAWIDARYYCVEAERPTKNSVRPDVPLLSDLPLSARLLLTDREKQCRRKS